MTIGELAVVMADIVVDSSDPLNVNFHKIFKNLPDEKYVRRELMYLKAFLVSFRAFVVSNSSNVKEADVATKLMVEKLSKYFNSNDYGCNPNIVELKSALDHYFGHVMTMFEYFHTVPKSKFKGENLEFFLSDYIIGAKQAESFFRFTQGNNYSDCPYIVSSSLLYGCFLDTYKQIKDILEEKTNPGSCFVATATYGNAFHPDVILLREFRDKYLSQSFSGKMFINLYYCVGPYLAVLPKNFIFIRRISRKVIEKIVSILKQKYNFNYKVGE